MAIDVTFLDAGREPQCEPDPNFPNGRLMDFGRPGMNRCVVELPYPAPRCGAWQMTCDICGLRLTITTAGRVDDPRTVALPCLPKEMPEFPPTHRMN